MIFCLSKHLETQWKPAIWELWKALMKHWSMNKAKWISWKSWWVSRMAMQRLFNYGTSNEQSIGSNRNQVILAALKYKVNSTVCVYTLYANNRRWSIIAGILTVRIHNLYSHLQQHRKDKHNYKQLRSMVHKRAKILKYLKSKDLERYNTCLSQLGLQPRAVEGEITL